MPSKSAIEQYDYGIAVINSSGKNVYNDTWIISAVCHGPAALLNIKKSSGEYLLKGVKITSRTIEEETLNGKKTREMVLRKFPIILEDELIKQGAVFTKESSGSDHIEISDRIITGQGPKSTTLMAKKVASLLIK